MKVTPSLPKSRHTKEEREQLKAMKAEQKAQRERERVEKERERAEKKAQKESEREAKKQEKEKELKEKRVKQEQREAEKKKKLEDNQLRCLFPEMSLSNKCNMCLIDRECECDLTLCTQNETRSQAKEGTGGTGETGVGELACSDFIAIHHQLP